mmetsp:Transcript_73433/g.153295  ORF Transcript_73433/g.153295 Transcript_73433/m.153295 type:complete len:201 (-) Transcript_73433:586-1188(-)
MPCWSAIRSCPARRSLEEYCGSLTKWKHVFAEGKCWSGSSSQIFLTTVSFGSRFLSPPGGSTRTPVAKRRKSRRSRSSSEHSTSTNCTNVSLSAAYPLRGSTCSSSSSRVHATFPSPESMRRSSCGVSALSCEGGKTSAMPARIAARCAATPSSSMKRHMSCTYSSTLSSVTATSAPFGTSSCEVKPCITDDGAYSIVRQ